MAIAKNSHLNISDVFNEYADPDKQPCFYTTRIPVKLMEYEGELLLSRSQAKRLITRFDKFLEVVLDFQGVTEIGHAFADEVFRVFKNAHPTVHLVPINCSPTVQRMIAYISADSCGGFHTPALCAVMKGMKADCNHLMRTTYPDALRRGMLIIFKIYIIANPYRNISNTMAAAQYNKPSTITALTTMPYLPKSLSNDVPTITQQNAHIGPKHDRKIYHPISALNVL